MENRYYTRQGNLIPKNRIAELDKDGFVISSFEYKIIDFGKNGK
jgi:hypothetical protein